MRSKKVATIISVYKNDDIGQLKEALNSIFRQTYFSDIYLCIDGQVENNVEIYLKNLSQENKIKIYRNDKNIGLAGSLNRLINVLVDLEYDYVARMDSDDISSLNRYELQVNFLENNSDIDVLGTGCSEFGASYALDEKILPQTHLELLNYSVTRCPFIHPTVMFRARVFKDGYRYPENTKLTEDMALWFTLLLNGYKFHNLQLVLLKYRMQEDTVKRRQGLKKAYSEFSIRMSYMIKLNKISFKNIILVSSRLAFHMLPYSILKILYKIRH